MPAGKTATAGKKPVPAPVPAEAEPTAARASPDGPPEQRITLHGIRWETYESLLKDLENSSAPRLAFDRGTLEIMSPVEEHERSNRALSLLVEVIAEERGIDIDNLGSTTFKREDLARGSEPDSCFYIQNAERIRGRDRIDLAVDPPPDLVIEIDITSPSLPRLPIYARLGVPEVWRYDGRVSSILLLEGGAYRESDVSVALPGLDCATLTALMDDSKTLKRTEWLRKLRGWARNQSR